jgi:hypothetical protein
MKRQVLPSAKFSNALLATRYLALQELREKVRRAEERLASVRLSDVSILRPASAMNTDMRRKDRKSWPAGSAIR